MNNTQHFVDRYMEDDAVYKIIGFVQDNLKLMIGLVLIAIATFWSGKIYGIKTQSVIYALKERYENIELQKKKLRKQILFLGTLNKAFRKFSLVLLFVDIILIVNTIYHRGFDYNIVLDNSLSRNMIVALFCGMLVTLLVSKPISKYQKNRARYLATIDSGLDDIAKRLLDSLGPELVTILKKKLLNRTVNTKTTSTQAGREPQPQPVPEFPEKEKFIKTIAEMEIINKGLLVELEKSKLTQTALKADLTRHKHFLQRLKSFEWCESCIQYAVKKEPEEETEENNEKESVEDKEKESVENKEKEAVLSDPNAASSPEQTHPKIEENIENQEKQKKVEEKDESPLLKDVEKEECKNDCLRRYFEMGIGITEYFNNEEREIIDFKEKFNLV